MSDFWYWDKGRVISLIIAIGCLILAFFFVEPFGWLKILGFLILPLACIWFGDELGGYTGTIKLIPVSQSPGGLVKFLGWVLLLSPIFIGTIFVINK